MKRLALLALALSAPARAADVPVESVTTYGHSLIGLWRVSRPDYVAIAGFFSPAKFGPLHENFCRITPQNNDLMMFCSGNREAATVTVEDRHVHFAWGTMMARFVIDGEMQSAAHFRGHYQIKVSGISFQNPAFSEALRVTPDTNRSDKGGKAALLRQMLDQGLASVPHDDLATKENGAITEVPRLGAVTAITYLGQERKFGISPGEPDQPDYFSVYLATFAQGERLCRLHQREDGVLDAFRCV